MQPDGIKQLHEEYAAAPQIADAVQSLEDGTVSSGA